MTYRFLHALIFCTILGISAGAGILFYAAEQPWVDFSVLEHYNPGKPSLLLDDEGKEWGRFELDKRDVCKLEDIPRNVIHAFVAAEDWNFFSHGGLSYKGIIRSALVNLVRFRRAQGASTITQQLVKLLYFENQKSFVRKIKEQILSISVERQFTKQQILETYLNHIYLGAGIYGVEAACQRFWGISVTQCSLEQAASLAAIVRYPRKYCPLYNKDTNKACRDIILDNMRKLGFITKEEYSHARMRPVVCHESTKKPLACHLQETIRQVLEEKLGKKLLYTGGLRIQTTINSSMQRAAERAYKQHFASLHKDYAPDLEGALVCIEGRTGAIKALVGGGDFGTSQFNRALQASRQMGSTFKALVFAQALIAGKIFADTDVDEPISLPQGSSVWTPNNAGRAFKGSMTLAHALSHSNNIISIKAFMESGPKEIVALAQACNLHPHHAYPSLSLGCLEATPLQSAAMMNIFAHHGRYTEPHYLVWVKDEWGTKLYKTHPTQRPVLPPSVADQVAHVLTLRIEQARSKHQELFPTCQGLGKSGTTNDSRTCWFVGATPSYTTAIYIGYDDNRSLGKWAFGSRTAFPLWRTFNKAIAQPTETFTYDSSLEHRTIDAITGERCAPEHDQAVTILAPRTLPS